MFGNVAHLPITQNIQGNAIFNAQFSQELFKSLI